MFCSLAMVTMHDGEQRELEFLHDGLQLLSRCETTGALLACRIRRCFESVEKTYYLHVGALDGRVQMPVEVTADQQFLVIDRGWVSLSELRCGDMLRTRHGNRVAIELIECSNDVDNVYSFELDGSESCFIGGIGLEARHCTN